MNLRPLLLPFAIVISSFGLSLYGAPPSELTVLRQQYEKAVIAPHAAAEADLDAKFIAALGNAATAAKQAGKLEEVLAIQDDQKRLTEKLPLPDDDEKTPESLKKLRTIYRDQLAKLEAQRTANHTALLPAYTARLKELEATLTKADRIEEAKEIKTYRERLATGPAAPALAAASPNAAEPPPAPVPGLAAAPVQAGKGDDRAAAELILSLGGKVMLSGKPEFIEDPGLLPKGRFTVARISFYDAQGVKMKRKLEAADADKLMHLEELYYFTVNRTITDDETLRFLASCPKLQYIHVENCGWLTGSWLQYAAPLKNLTVLTALEAAKTDTSAFGSFQSLVLTDIQLRNTSTDDQTLLALSRFKKLRAAKLRLTKITDSGMSHLSELKDLVSLDVSETPVSIEGMKALAGVPLTELGFGMSPEDMAAAVPELATLFPKVVDFQYPPRGVTSAAHLGALGKAWPKLKRLEFPSNHEFEPDAFISAGPLFPSLEYLYLWKTKINDSHIPGIAQMKKLATLNLTDSQITDAGLAELAKMKSLKGLYVSGTKVTDAGLAAFKKVRRDVAVTK